MEGCQKSRQTVPWVNVTDCDASQITAVCDGGRDNWMPELATPQKVIAIPCSPLLNHMGDALYGF